MLVWRFASTALSLFLLTGPVVSQEAIRFSWPVNAGPLNPHLYSPNQMFAQGMVYEPLVRYQPDGKIVPWLAQAWDVSPDGRVYIFQLRLDVRFSNGEVFNAAAAAANFNAVLANRQQHAWLELANQILSADAIGDYTLQLTLKEPYYPLLQELALLRPFRFAAPSQFINEGTKEGILAPVGTGPWIFAQARPFEFDLFVRNDTYWGAKPDYPSVEIKIIPDANTRTVAFETGEIDLIYGVDGQISPDTFERFRNSGTATAELSEPMETHMLALNTGHGPTADLAVRRAINHAVNKDLMVSHLFHGTQSRADTLFAANVPYADIGLAPYAYDPEKSVELLEDAGWMTDTDGVTRSRNGEPLIIDLCFIGNDANARAMAEVVQAELAKIGISAVLVGEEESSINARQVDGRFGMIFNRTWGAPYDPHAFVSSMRVPSHADYQAQLGLTDKAEIDARIGEVLLSTDEAARQDLYTQILTRLHEEAVYLPLTYARAIVVAKPELGDVPFGAISSEIPFDKLIRQND
ncbi:nickel ABC transporter, nickel/metallophore periplasmic binding protein [Aureimonas fodinaquatilis]|uniref:Nickel ABC transporter, nickel/metallophore periplasmic binding protein n=2 Tax=Aureimonas fodinaquatilis TaxID=2565783 RepID=A0A5B0E1L5_9HYPH|nr:nickel ABC transporter substrate-binding protein [Aureimonas fodinaquatilis]KAA0972548.1 nickel ABC transporter, nickel/metallophore periplasmic binding protein [Aureimonas fodinaquatilis]